MEWKDLADELMRARQALGASKDLRDLGPADFSIRPLIAGPLWRYTRGRCLDFAFRLAERDDDLRLAGLYAPEGLTHAFLVRAEDLSARGAAGPDCRCVDMSGEWTLAEMKRLHRHEGPNRFWLCDMGTVRAEMRADEERGSTFDSEELVLAVAGCLPHLMDRVPEEFRASDASEAAARLRELELAGYDPSAVAIAPARRP